jgi:hypothetical protein
VKILTKTAIAATILSVAYLLFSLTLKKLMVTDGKIVFSVVLWEIPHYRNYRLPDKSWWYIARLWLASVSLPPILWASVGLRHLFAKQNANQVADS